MDVNTEYIKDVDHVGSLSNVNKHHHSIWQLIPFFLVTGAQNGPTGISRRQHYQWNANDSKLQQLSTVKREFFLDLNVNTEKI